MNTQTAQQRAEIMTTIVNGIEGTIVSLKGRWLDEKEYENFNDYKKILETEINKYIPQGGKILKIAKSFSILLELPNFPYNPEIFCTTTTLGWRSKK